MSAESYAAKDVIVSIVKHASAYLSGEIGLTVKVGQPFSGEIKAMPIRDVMAIIGLGGPVSLMISFGFDRKLVEAMFDVSTEGLSIAEDERELYMQETAAETINVVLGQSTSDLATAGQNVTLSPPLVIENADRIHKPRGAHFTTVTISTDRGDLDVNFVAPRNLFDDMLNR